MKRRTLLLGGWGGPGSGSGGSGQGPCPSEDECPFNSPNCPDPVTGEVCNPCACKAAAEGFGGTDPNFSCPLPQPGDPDYEP